MKTESIFKQLRRRRHLLSNSRNNSKKERQPLKKRSLCSNKNWLMHLHPSPPRKKTMVTRRLLKKLKPKWQHFKRVWTTVLQQPMLALKK
jgi:hypothetical protein